MNKDYNMKIANLAPQNKYGAYPFSMNSIKSLPKINLFIDNYSNEKIDPRQVAYKQLDDPLRIERINSYLRKYFFVDYYESSISDNTDENIFRKISSQYTSLNDYTKDKLIVNKMISDDIEIPDSIDKRLTITKQELESVNMFEVFGTI